MPLKVFITTSDSSCNECGEALGRHAWITLVEDKGALCLSCADLDHLVFLPSGDTALTRRAGKHSTLSAVVLKWSRARKRYERQGLLIEEQALQRAEQECLAETDARARRQERRAKLQAGLDQQYIERFAAHVREIFPGCPLGREMEIAEHACQKYSGRVGRSAAAKQLDTEIIELAVIAHIRHAETEYDALLTNDLSRCEARDQVKDDVDRVIARWRLLE